MAGEVKWIKITTDIFDDEKILLIECLPEKDSLIVIWFKLLCMAGKQNNSGVFMLNDRIAYTDEMLATIFRRPLNTVRLALSTFEQYGMIEILDGVITIPNWGKHQNLDQLESRKEYMKNYMDEYRKKQKALTSGENVRKVNSKVNSKVNVNCADKEREEEREEREENNKKKSVKENTHTLFERLLPDYNIPFSVSEKLKEWITYKTERKEPYKEQGMKSFLRQVENKSLEYGEQAICDLIDECMSSGWKGIIYDRLEQKKANTFNNGTAKPQSSNNNFMNELQRLYEEC